MSRNGKQNQTDYNPTRGEKKLLDILLDPIHRTKTVTTICELAEVSRDVYYTAFKKPDFVGYYNDRCLDIVKLSLGPVVNAFISEAKRGSYTHGKVLLEMAGLYTEKKNVQLTTPNKLEDLFPGKKKAE